VLDAVLKRMRFPYLRDAAPEVLATARSQQWDPAVVVRILLGAEIAGRNAATKRNHRQQTKSLTATLGRAAVDNSVSKTVAKITRCELIVVDDIGLLPCGQAAAEACYRLIDAAYERRSVIVTGNIHPDGYDSIMPKTLATAAADRLLHHSHIVATEGTSLRLGSTASPPPPICTNSWPTRVPTPALSAPASKPSTPSNGSPPPRRLAPDRRRPVRRPQPAGEPGTVHRPR
jgi:hypothetical protein